MNEQQFQAWLVDRAPVTVPASLRERVGAIPTDVAQGGGAVGRRLWSMSLAKGRRRPIALGLLAAAVIGSIAVAGVALERRDASPPVNGRIIVTVPDGNPVAVDLATSTTIAISDLGTGGAIEPGVLDGAHSVAWSPDGRSIAFVGPRSNVGVLDLQTGQTRTLAEDIGLCGDHGCGVAWAPDGHAIALTADTEIRRIDVPAGTVTTIATAPAAVFSPSWSPDGRSIAFAAENELFTVGSDGTGLTRLVSDVGDRAGPTDVHWSPDGKRIGFLTSNVFNEAGWKLEIDVVDPDGSNRHAIADAGDCFCLGWGPPGFTWSPDGTQIAFVTLGFTPDGRVHDSHLRTGGGLYVANLDGSGRRLIAPDLRGSPAWQPVP